MSSDAIQPVLGCLLIFGPAVSGIASFWPSARGHWSGAVMATPALLIGFLFMVALCRATGGVMPALLFISPATFLIGLASLALWARRRVYNKPTV